jgi:hypothetical protein
MRDERDEVTGDTRQPRRCRQETCCRKSGLPLSIALPARAFKGVAARAIDHGDGTVTVTLELHHTDTALCVPLLVAHNLDDIAADWRAWSELYGLPMLMVEADGVARPLDDGSAQPTAGTTRRVTPPASQPDRRPPSALSGAPVDRQAGDAA